jgi:hypothetical protein
MSIVTGNIIAAPGEVARRPFPKAEAGAGAAWASSHFPAPGADDDSRRVLKALQQAAWKITAGFDRRTRLTSLPG